MFAIFAWGVKSIVEFDYKNLKREVYPIIGGERIKEFLCKDGTLKTSEKEEKCVPVYDLRRFQKEIIDTAREIATLCDKCKVR